MPQKKRPQTKAQAVSQPYAHTRHCHQRELAEDYAEMIDALIREKGEARAVDVAQRMGVSHVTVSKTILRLKEAGWVSSEPYRSIFLTPAGQELAEATRRRHQVVLDFLVKLGVEPQAARLDAEGIEHHVSDETLRAMQDYLDKNS